MIFCPNCGEALSHSHNYHCLPESEIYRIAAELRAKRGVSAVECATDEEEKSYRETEED